MSCLKALRSHEFPNWTYYYEKNVMIDRIFVIIGEGWQEIMMACSSNPKLVKCDSNSDEANVNGCGSDIAFPYFISFYVLCSFLVSAHFIAFKFHRIIKVLKHAYKRFKKSFFISFFSSFSRFFIPFLIPLIVIYSISANNYLIYILVILRLILKLGLPSLCFWLYNFNIYIYIYIYI